MAADTGTNRTLQFTGLAALIAAVFTALVWKEVPLDVPRPAASEIRNRETTSQDVAARLWEDPFAVVARDPLVAALSSPKPEEVDKARIALGPDGNGRHTIEGVCR